MTNNEIDIETNEDNQSSTTTYRIRCQCCGKIFESYSPKVDLCSQCMSELADAFVFNYNDKD